MKKTIRVTTVKELEIDIDDNLLTDESVAEFSSSMFEVADIIEIFEHAAYNIAEYGPVFVEGLGKSSHYASEGVVVFKELENDVEFEEIV